MKEKLAALKIEYRTNPGWCWLLAILFLFPLLPEYVSPFILFAGFIVFKVQWSREGRKAKVGTIGKMMMLFMGYALLSTLWSPTSFSTFSTAALWWGMFLLQVMIYNLARSRDKIDALLQTCTASACVNGVIGTLQICGYTLNRYDCIPDGAVLVTPLYKGLDKFVYTHLPFAISTKTFDSRASGTFSNPNLLATHMVIAYPISIYLFLNAKTKKQKVLCFLANVLISAGLSSTLTRAGCVIALAGWVFMFIVLCRRYWKQMLTIFLPTVAVIVPSILTRYGIIFSSGGNGEAKKSSVAHFNIWESLIDYVLSHTRAFFIGTGFGCEETGNILKYMYNLDKPHAHNFVIEFWVELGVVGIILLGILLIWSAGKLLEINTNNSRKLTLVFCVFTSLVLYLGFGLSDFIFNSPKQMIFLFLLLGLTQSISYCYDKTVITDARTLERAARKEIRNTLNQ